MNNPVVVLGTARTPLGGLQGELSSLAAPQLGAAAIAAAVERSALGGRAVDEVYDMWAAEFDYAYANVPDGVFTLTMHPQVIGRGPRLEMLERLIDHIQAHDRVAFSRIDAIVSRMNGNRQMVTTITGETE